MTTPDATYTARYATRMNFDDRCHEVYDTQAAIGADPVMASFYWQDGESGLDAEQLMNELNYADAQRVATAAQTPADDDSLVVYCEQCGNEVDPAVAVLAGEQMVCPGCASDDTPRCELCGELAVLVGEQWVCPECSPIGPDAALVLSPRAPLSPAPATAHPPTQVHFFYDWSGNLSTDGEGGLVQLCASCARLHGDNVQKASKGDDQSECELCDASNDPAYSIELDSIMGRLMARAA